MSMGNAGNRWTLVTKPTDHEMPSAGIGHDQEKPGAEPESVRAGHEPDWFDARGVVFIPILVVIAAVLTYGVVTLLFAVFDPGKADDRGANPMAKAENDKPFNERVTRISSQDENAKHRQPRLEWVRQVEPKHAGEPTYYRSMKTPETGNPPEIRPEDLRAENFVDWNTGEKPLADYKWLSQGKGVARIPVSEAMKILAADKKLPAKAGRPAAPPKPTLSNGGQGRITDTRPTSAPVPKADAPKPEPKKDETKKDELKKDEKKK